MTGIFVALIGACEILLIGGMLLILPKLWRPEVQFGVSVPFAGTEEVRRRAVRYWRIRTAALVAALLACWLAVAWMRYAVFLLTLILFALMAVSTVFYTHARRMLAPLSRPYGKVGASLRPRRYRDYMNPRWEVIPLLLLVVGLAVMVDIWIPRQIGALWGLARGLGAQVLVYAVLFVTAVMIAHAKQSIGRGNPEICARANEAFRRVWIRYFYALRVSCAMNLVLFALGVGLANKGIIGPAVGRVLTFLVGGSVATFMIAGIVIALRYGQGGWRWAVRKGLAQKAEVAAMFDGDGMPDKHWKLGMFYFNRDDPAVFVEKRFGVGWTFNMANPLGCGSCLPPSSRCAFFRRWHFRDQDR